jgi:hypothetical protein
MQFCTYIPTFQRSLLTLKMKAAGSSKMLVPIYQTIWCFIPVTIMLFSFYFQSKVQFICDSVQNKYRIFYVFFASHCSDWLKHFHPCYNRKDYFFSSSLFSSVVYIQAYNKVQDWICFEWLCLESNWDLASYIFHAFSI